MQGADVKTRTKKAVREVAAAQIPSNGEEKTYSVTLE